MSRFVLIYVSSAAFLTAGSVTEAQYRVTHAGYLLVPDPYLPLIRACAVALWVIAVVAVVARENRSAAAAHQVLQTRQIEDSNRKLVEAVTALTDAVLSDVDQRKRAEINSMLAEYGIDSGREDPNRNRPVFPRHAAPKPDRVP
jgi:hypothetical protein